MESETAYVPKSMIDITPSHLRCSYGGCPAVFAQEDGTVAIVGKRNPTLAAALAQKGKIAPDEEVVFIPREYLKDVPQD